MSGRIEWRTCNGLQTVRDLIGRLQAARARDDHKSAVMQNLQSGRHHRNLCCTRAQMKELHIEQVLTHDL